MDWIGFSFADPCCSFHKLKYITNKTFLHFLKNKKIIGGISKKMMMCQFFTFTFATVRAEIYLSQNFHRVDFYTKKFINDFTAQRNITNVALYFSNADKYLFWQRIKNKLPHFHQRPSLRISAKCITGKHGFSPTIWD